MHANEIVLTEVDSTMAEAARRAPELAGPTWVLALNQTAARGRRGRPWRHPSGNFAATLVMESPPPAQAALRSFVAALALYDTFEALSVDRLALKWPNDVLVGGAKVAGILLESLATGHLSIGIGINLRVPPDASEVEEGAVLPVALGVSETPEQVLGILNPAFAKWEHQLATLGFAPIREAWLARAAKVGEVIRARTASETHVGTFETIDMDGQLVLSTAEGRLTIPAADVYF
ncbi:MAG: biotin--[acetyl-CoA-carboxylase] ligase [Pseudomonadota bacterium]